ncbi:MAG: glycosyltransferase family 9 protein [Melioribacteraceae bacterium]
MIVRQHNQFGDLLASVSLFRAVKESFPGVHLTLIASPENYFAVVKNEYIDDLIIYDRKKILNPYHLLKFRKKIRDNYDLAIVPATVAVSVTSCLIAAFSKSNVKIGPLSLNGKKNDIAYVFNHRIDLDWRRYPDAHVSEFILDIVRPFGIKTKNYRASISFDGNDVTSVNGFLDSFPPDEFRMLIGLHVGAGKIQNRWSLNKYAELIERIGSKYKIKFYFTGSDADSSELSFMKNRLGDRGGYFLNKTIPELTALISRSDFFFTNDTGVMHVAGATETPQISIFGPTNPFNWAPVGSQKYFIRKSELIDDVSVDDVENLFELILMKKN